MLIDLLELATNNVLEYDSQSRERLAKLQGKTITLEIKPFSSLQSSSQTISVSPQTHGLEFYNQPNVNPDVTLIASVGALMKIGRDGLDDAKLEAGELVINGDPIVGQRFARVLADLQIDWEGLLADHIGEPPAILVSTGFGMARDFAQESRSVFKRQLHKLLVEDLHIIASKNDVEPFLDEVDMLRADADRLQTRVNRLKSKL